MESNTIQQNIPSGWQVLPIGKHIKLQGGNAFSASNYVSDGIPLVRIGNVGKGDFVANDFVYISEDEHASNESVHLKENDILMGMTGELGKVARIGKQHLPAILNQRVGRVIFKDKYLDPDFTFQLFLSKDFISKLEKYFIGAAQKNISSSQVESVEVLVPPIKEQQKIAEILRTVDEDISKTQGVIEAAEKLKRGLMQQLFTRGIGHTKFKETRIGQIPEGWEVGGFKNLVNPDDKNAIKPGPFGSALKKSFYVEKGFKIYGQEQVISGDAFYGNYYINDEKYKELEGFKVNAGDILISLVGTIGKVLIIPESFEKGIINPRLLKITPDKTKADSQFIVHLLKSDYLIQEMGQKSHGGTMNILNKGMLVSVNFGIPPLDEQKEIAEVLSAIDEKVSVNKKLKEKLTLLKKGLMQYLLSGKVRVAV